MKTKNSAKKTYLGSADPLAERINVATPVVALATNYPNGYVIKPHMHDRYQLVHAISGLMTVTTEKGIWLVPPHRAVWVPAFMEHSIEVTGELMMRSLFVRSDYVPEHMASECFVVSVSPLLRELILYAAAMPKECEHDGHQERIILVILDLLSKLENLPIKLPFMKDGRLIRLFEMLSQDVSNNMTLDEWGAKVGATARNLERLFRSETGLTFGQWRQHLRVMEAMKYLAMNEPVTSVAMKVGYSSPSAFIAVFKRFVGSTPGEYFG